MTHAGTRMLLVGAAAAAITLATMSPATARLNPPDWNDYNCYLLTTAKSGAAWDSNGTLNGTLYYGADDEVHGESGVCEWLAHSGIKAVQSRWAINITFSVPKTRYKESNLTAARGSGNFVAMSDASSTQVTSRSDAGYIAFDFSKGMAGIEVGGSRTENFKRKMLPGQDLRIPIKLHSRELGRCGVTEESGSRIQVTCVWVLDVGALSWFEPRGRTDGGLQRMSLNVTASFPGARSVTLEGVFTDNA